MIMEIPNIELLPGEIFKVYPKNSNYSISNKGRVYSNKYKRLIKLTLNRGGYLWCNISSPETYGVANRVHRLVAFTFLGENPKDRPDVNHIDGNKQNNCVENLEWSNKSLNGFHAYKNGLNHTRNHLRGENHYFAKITNETARQVKIMLKNGVKRKEISKVLNVSMSTVNQIAVNRVWKLVTI